MLLYVIQVLKIFAISSLIDGIWLMSMGQRLYRHYLGYLFADTFQYGWAVLFYMIYAVAINHFIVQRYISQPQVSMLHLFLEAFFFGLVVYSAYDLTNQATIKNWPLIVTMVDMLWGATLTGMVSVIAYKLIK